MRGCHGEKIDQFGVALADCIICHPWKVIVGSVLIVIVAACGARNLEFSNNYRVFFDSDNPGLRSFESFHATYTKNDTILIVIQPKENDVFSSSVVEVIEKKSEQAWKVPYAIRVDSITNFQHSWAVEDNLTVEDLVSNGGELTEGQFAGTAADLGLLLEYNYDARDDDDPITIYDSDLFVGSRLILNDSQDTTALCGVIIDMVDGPQFSALRLKGDWDSHG